MKSAATRIEVFLIRHAEAQPRRRGRRDATRQLTRKGRAEFRHVVRRLHSVGFRFDLILSSPWDRAAQTASILHPLCPRAPRLTVLLARKPDRFLIQRINSAELRHHGNSTRIALVGHEPWLSELMSLLMRDPASLENRPERLRKGSVTRLVRPKGGLAFRYRGQWDPKRREFLIEH